MTSRDSLIKTLSAIEEHASDKLSIDFLSSEACFSSSHLQRLFKLTTGQSLIDYVRGRKLAHSLEKLLNTDFRIIDIANIYGFQHEQSYIRAFQREFGCTPGQVRKNKHILPIRERIIPKMLQSFGQGVLYGPEIVMVPSFHIVGNPHFFVKFDSQKDALEPNKLGKNFFYRELAHIPNVIHPEVYIGYVSSSPDENNRIEYMPSVQVKDLSSVPKNLKGRTLPSNLCVRFRYTGEHHYEEINMISAYHTYVEIDSFFAKQSRYISNDNFFLERIDISLYDGVYCQMEWLYPVTDLL